MNNCPKCGASLPPNSSFCRECGAKLEKKPTITCPRCGYSAEEGTRKCPECGKKFKKNKRKHFPKRNWLMLLPTILLVIYDSLLENGIISKVYKTKYATLQFYSLGENEFMILLARVCFVWLPCLFTISALFYLTKKLMRNVPEEIEEIEETEDNASQIINGAQKETKNPEYSPSEESEKEPSSARQNLPVLQKIDREFSGRPPRQISDSMKPLSFKTAADDLVTHCAHKGVTLPIKTARSILAAIAADCLIFIDGKRRSVNEALFAAVSDFFGGSIHPCAIDAGCRTPSQLAVSSNADNVISETNLLIDLYRACYETDELRFALLENLDPIEAANYFSEYIYAIENRHINASVTVDTLGRTKSLNHINDGKLLFPKNMRLIVAPKFGISTMKLSAEAITLDLSEVTATELAQKSASDVHFRRPYDSNDIIKEQRIAYSATKCRDTSYLSEIIWKKIDKLEAYLNTLMNYKLTNRKTRLMERYSSAYIAAGGSEAEALDSTLVSCIFSELYPARNKFAPSGDIINAVTFLENEFGTETIPDTIETVRKFFNSSSKNTPKASEETQSDTESSRETIAVQNVVLDKPADTADKESVIAESADTAVNETVIEEPTDTATDETVAENSADATAEEATEEATEKAAEEATEEAAEEAAEEETADISAEETSETNTDDISSQAPIVVDADSIFSAMSDTTSIEETTPALNTRTEGDVIDDPLSILSDILTDNAAEQTNDGANE